MNRQRKLWITLKKMRSEKGSEEMIVDAVAMEEILEIDPVFSMELQIRQRKQTRQFDYLV